MLCVCIYVYIYIYKPTQYTHSHTRAHPYILYSTHTPPTYPSIYTTNGGPSSTLPFNKALISPCAASSPS